MSRTADPIEDTSAQLKPARTEDGKRKDTAPHIGDTLLTVLLVLYPALATVGAIAAGLMFSGTSV